MAHRVVLTLTVAAIGACTAAGCSLSSRAPQYLLGTQTHPEVGAYIIWGGPAAQAADQDVQAQVDKLLSLKPSSRSAQGRTALAYQVPGSGWSRIVRPIMWLELRQATRELLRAELARPEALREVDLLPELVLPAGATADLDALRVAAARAQADEILVYAVEAGYELRLNAWALLYPTVVGAFVAPGVEGTSMVVVSAVLVDVPTGYIRLVSEAYGQQSASGTLGTVDFEELESEARKAALKTLAQDVARRIADGA